MKAFWSTALLVALASAGCMGDAPPRPGEFSETDIGVASIALSSIPSGVRCVRITARPIPAGTEYVTSVSTTGRTSFTTTMTGLPLGNVQFAAVAFAVECTSVVASTVPSWQSAASSTTLRVDRVPDVAITLYPVRSTQVTANFQHDFRDVHQCGLAMIGLASNNSLQGTGMTAIASAAASTTSGVREVACGPYEACNVQSNNAVYCWGVNRNMFPSNIDSNLPWTVPNVTASSVDVGLQTACAITTAGSVQCWGNGADGIVVPTSILEGFLTPRTPPGITSAVPELVWQQVAVGATHACALASNGRIHCWGQSQNGQLGTTNVRFSSSVFVDGVTNGTIKLAASWLGMYALRANGQIARWGDNLGAPVLVDGISDAIDIAAGLGSACALRANGDVVCWGDGGNGQHGDGHAQTTRRLPTNRVAFQAGWDPVIAITGEEDSYCALHADGQVSCWGNNSTGNLGDGTFNNAYEPVLAERWDTRTSYLP